MLARIRLQAHEYTTSFIPFVMAVMRDEDTAGMTRLFSLAKKYWPRGDPDTGALESRVCQMHKDYAACIEAARDSEFPGARSVGDFPHFMRRLEVRSKQPGVDKVWLRQPVLI